MSKRQQKRIRVIGGGLAGPEAALQAAKFGCPVDLYEMRPTRSTEAHQTADFAELVCSNSLKSESENTAPWLLKQEMRLAGSVLLTEADASAVPAGHALAVDRVEFSRRVAARIAAEPHITVHREEVTTLDESDTETITILATGPLTSPALAAELQRLTGSTHLAFYDSISPIVDASTIDMDKVYLAARWDKGTADYINCPFTKEEYEAFLEALTAAETVPAKEWEQIPSSQNRHPEHSGEAAPAKTSQRSGETAPAKTSQNCHPERSGEAAQSKDLRLSGATEPLQYFEGCLPIEETARRGPDTLRFGPMKPAGLTNPKTGRWPYAVVQLRQENLRADSYNLVGFQNHLKFGEQQRVLRMIPGLENATFLRYGQIHRNTYINAPALLTETLQLRRHPNILIAGQLSGVEGYTESIASGMLAGRYAAAIAQGQQPTPAPRASANGSLTHYITHAESKKFQPANITFDLLLPLEEELRKKIRDKKERHRIQCERALEAWKAWLG
ncbi:methylenetetrahydrofolate--tRNA-(uracil(54)-C(5))-methyltransferase (FADH(2)-oxidizing) TrmFO [Edaphobacter sp.]|uniref:methylenetetrahydrofolate--tRNA-(uracil(54)- C(5))-methyltransferase (FADH(2)-oxidizing) TrmFO n=1 Tax=Edaphobacter sp. TaxID=1934404 RepID=UPI002DB6D11D|nr:methylenetetrahydrofolate--tRNA-(uracil(54)-C(5))-methyltransferase (FADH(2)-oxidizing) TrmFO [Edaphobacter sp.]HEU5340835.1 methylenetetrahydrofolate--tRNA-(uracil(54)-C(5))-methyltransferase (FADH(2)-oxidizing) TrmFO [Edaphobacter sp.]